MTCKEQEFKLRVMDRLDFCEVSGVFVKELEGCQTYETCSWVFVLPQRGYYKYIWRHPAIYASQLDSNQVIELSVLRNCFDLNTTAKDRKMEDDFCCICRAINSLTGSNKKLKNLMNKIVNSYCSANHLKLKD